jgi:hypothetical protein
MIEDLWTDNQSDDLMNVQIPKAATTGARHIGCPMWWFSLVFPIARSKGELAVAIYLYRLRAIQRSRTVVVGKGKLLTELGIDRFVKSRTIQRLAAAGIVTVKRHSGRAPRVTFKRKYNR